MPQLEVFVSDGCQQSDEALKILREKLGEDAIVVKNIDKSPDYLCEFLKMGRVLTPVGKIQGKSFGPDFLLREETLDWIGKEMQGQDKKGEDMRGAVVSAQIC